MDLRAFGVDNEATRSGAHKLAHSEHAFHSQGRSTGAVRAEGFWSRAILREDVGDVDVSDAAMQLLKQMPDDPTVWLTLPATPKLIFSLGMPRSNCGFDIRPDIARLAADRGIVLGFDIYGESIWAKD